MRSVMHCAVMTSHDMTPGDRLGERIKAARIERGWSQETLARALVPPRTARTVIRWEQEASTILSLDQIQRLADVLGVDFSDLVPDCESGGAAA